MFVPLLISTGPGVCDLGSMPSANLSNDSLMIMMCYTIELAILSMTVGVWHITIPAKVGGLVLKRTDSYCIL